MAILERILRLFASFRAIWPKKFCSRFLRILRHDIAFLDVQLPSCKISARCRKYTKRCVYQSVLAFTLMKYPNEYCYNAVINSYSTMPYYDVINNIKNHIIGLKVVLNASYYGICGL